MHSSEKFIILHNVTMDWNNPKDITNGIEEYSVSKEMKSSNSEGEHKVTVLCVNSSDDSDDEANKTKTKHCIFQYVKTNIPGPDCEVDKFLEQFSGCSCTGVCSPGLCACMKLFGCSYTEDGKLSEPFRSRQPSRPVLECGRHCKCGRDCISRVVQNGITRNFCVFQTRHKGFGLKLSENSNNDLISAFAFVCEYAGEVIGYEEARRRVLENEYRQRDNYVIALREHVGSEETCTYIDPSSLGNLGRFINHSCKPNLIMVPVRVNHPVPRLSLFACRDIYPGEELTFDYSGAFTFATSTKDNTYNYKTDVGTRLLDKADNNSCHDEPILKKCKFLPCPDRDLPSCINGAAQANAETLDRSLSSELHRPKSYQQCDIEEELSSSCGCPPETNSQNQVYPKVRRKLCCCGSENCMKYLPFDGGLLTEGKKINP